VQTQACILLQTREFLIDEREGGRKERRTEKEEMSMTRE
jgi:hypothetical protein